MTRSIMRASVSLCCEDIEMTKQHLQEQLEYLRARYDGGAVSPAVYQAIKKLETDIAWCEHVAREREIQSKLRICTSPVAGR